MRFRSIKILIFLIVFLLIPVDVFCIKLIFKDFNAGQIFGGYTFAGGGAYAWYTNDKTMFAPTQSTNPTLPAGSLKLVCKTAGSDKGSFYAAMVNMGFPNITACGGGGISFFAKSDVYGFPLKWDIRYAMLSNPGVQIGENLYTVDLTPEWKKYIIPFTAFGGFDPSLHSVKEFGWKDYGFNVEGMQYCNVDEIYFLDAVEMALEQKTLQKTNKILDIMDYSVSAGMIIPSKAQYSSVIVKMTPSIASVLDVKVLDLYGNIRKSLISGQQCTSGLEIQISWDGKDDSGKILSSGIYIMNLVLKSQNGSEKIVKQKQIIIGK